MKSFIITLAIVMGIICLIVAAHSRNRAGALTFVTAPNSVQEIMRIGGTISPSYTLELHNKSGGYFYFDCSGDTLKTGGTLKPDSGAKLLMKYLIEDNNRKIKELRDTIKMLRKSIVAGKG